MAFGTPTSRGTTNAKLTGGTDTLAHNPTGNINVGVLAYVHASVDNTALTDGDSNNLSLSDSKGNTWTKVFEHTNTGAGAERDGVTHGMWVSKIATQILTTDTITLQWTAPADGSTAVQMGVGDVTIADSYAVEAELQALGTTAPTVTLSGMTSREYLLIGSLGNESNDVTIAEDADYTNLYIAGTTGGSATSNVMLNVATRIATLTTDTYALSGVGNAESVIALVAIYETTSGGTGHTATITDPEDLVDSTSQVVDSTRSQSDPLGITDPGGAELYYDADPLDISDSVGFTLDRPITDASGLTDIITVESGSGRVVTDGFGLTDGATQIVSAERSSTDDLGLTDSIVVEATGTHARQVDDVLGLADDITVDHVVGGVDHTATITDVLGLVDTIAFTATYDPTLVDVLGLVDDVLIPEEVFIPGWPVSTDAGGWPVSTGAVGWPVSTLEG